MSARQKRLPKTKTSKRYCQQRYCCATDQAEALYECAECGNVQCYDCERNLHKEKRFQLHDRTLLEGPPEELLCNYLACKDKNFADIRCDDCHGNYCYICSDQIHKSLKRKGHKIIRMKEYLDSKKVASVPKVDDSEDDFQSLNSDLLKAYGSPNRGDFVMPSSPIFNQQLKDGSSLSLTYVSCPQGSDNLEMHSVRGSPPVTEQPNASPRSFKSGAIINQPAPSKKVLDVNERKMSSSTRSIPDVAADVSISSLDDETYADCESFMLADDLENLKCSTVQDFIQKLGCDDPDTAVKVVSVFGNTGDGKSYTLNHTFFGGKEVFKTSSHQVSCTAGVWAAYDHVHKAIIIDTEGLLGISTNQNQRTRLLLKVLAVSDVVIYRTRAERLHSDLYRFLGDASQAFDKHFTQELEQKAKKTQLPLCDLGPSIVVFHETQHTDVLGKGSHKSAEEHMRERFKAEGYTNLTTIKALVYVGSRTKGGAKTDFRGLRNAVKEQLSNMEIRSPRKFEVIFHALQVLNDKFSGDIEKVLPLTFPDQYFSCTLTCLSCSARCLNSMNHDADDIPHSASTRCIYQQKFDNKVYLCKKCHRNGRCSEVVPKAAASTDSQWFAVVTYAVSGYVLECPRCGVIYRSRQHWYGNRDPEEGVVIPEIRHVWPGGSTILQGTHNAARRLIDGLHYMSDAVSSVGAKPTRALGNLIADKVVNPPYWVPNSEIHECHACQKDFNGNEGIHHCRACGKGFCDDCSSRKRPVPEKGWGPDPVRVCDTCFEVTKMTESSGSDTSENQVTTRQVTEGITSALGKVAMAMDYPIGVIKDSARPGYWIPDDQITNCCSCNLTFGTKIQIHHCRSCGQGVCNDCSGNRRPVPSRGWDYDVRVCNTCNNKKGQL